ncbi:MAG: hypothetical protein IT168_22565 [Bryobacterales bacterium]|nr:hypothetical protein [Bryobacterales bacterium]
MRRWALLVCLLVPLNGAEIARGRTMALRFETGEFSNLAFHVLCLADQIPCAADAYRQLWRDRLEWSDADDRQITHFRAVLRALPADYEQPAPLPLNYPSYYPSVVKLHRLKAAMLGADDADDARKRLTPVVDKEAAQDMAEVVAHFEPRFRRWWKQEGSALLKKAPAELRELTLKHDVLGTASDFASMLGARPLDARPVRIHLIARPPHPMHSSYATQVGDEAVMEVGEEDKPAELIGPLAHELFHLLYDTAPRERHQHLLEEFLNNPDPAALSFYAYFNEALATAVGATIDERVLGEEASRVRGRNVNYAHPYIARLGAALTPLVRERLAEHSSLLSEIAEPYLQAGRLALGSAAASPRFLLAHRTVQGNREMMTALGPLLAPIPAVATVAGTDALDRFPNLNAVVFATPQDLLSEEFKHLATSQTLLALRELAAQRFAFVYAQPRQSKSMTYYFVGESAGQLRPLVRDFATSDLPFTGLALHLRR